jgi:hypothetical protein
VQRGSGSGDGGGDDTFSTELESEGRAVMCGSPAAVVWTPPERDRPTTEKVSV